LPFYHGIFSAIRNGFDRLGVSHTRAQKSFLTLSKICKGQNIVLGSLLGWSCGPHASAFDLSMLEAGSDHAYRGEVWPEDESPPSSLGAERLRLVAKEDISLPEIR
jgi:hypothetical protein